MLDCLTITAVQRHLGPPQTRAGVPGFSYTKHIMPFHLFIFLKNHGTLGDPGCRVKLTDP